MADGNELDDDLTEDSVPYETHPDGISAFAFPMSGLPTEQQRIWADSLARKVLELTRDSRALRSQVDNANRLANETNSVVSDIIYDLSDEMGDGEENLDPLTAPSQPTVTSRLGQFEISWDGLDVEGEPMATAFQFLNIYAVKTSELPADPDWDLNQPEDDGTPEVANPDDPIYDIPDDGPEVPAPDPDPVPLTVWPPAPVGVIRETNGNMSYIMSDLEYNEEYTVWFMAVDKLGNLSPASPRTTASVQPLVNTDIIGRVIEEGNIALDALDEKLLSPDLRERLNTMEEGIEEAMQSGGGNLIWYRSTTNPPPSSNPTPKVGDTWFVTNEGNKIRMWTGTEWSDRPFGTPAIEDLAITNAKIGNLDAGKVTTGYLAADRIQARTIGVDKLLVADTKNLAWDGNYSTYAGTAWGSAPSGGTGSTWDTTFVRPGTTVSQKLTEKDAGTATASLYSAMRAVTINPPVNTDRLVYVGNRTGEKMVAYAHFYVSKTPPGGMTSLSTRIYFYKADGTNINLDGGSVARADVVPGEWRRVGGTQATVPADAVFAVLRPTVYYANGTTDVNGTVYYLGGEEMYWADAGELIVDGTISGNKLVANSITGDKIVGNTITGDKIAALTIEAGNIKSNAITADKIEAGAITAAKLDAEAINGSTITGGVFIGGLFTLDSVASATTVLSDPCETVSPWAGFSSANPVLSSAQKHGGTYSLIPGISTVSTGREMRRNIPAGSYVRGGTISAWVYPTSSAQIFWLKDSTGGANTRFINLPLNTWSRIDRAVQPGSSVSWIGVSSTGSTATFYVDDVSVISFTTLSGKAAIDRLENGQARVYSEEPRGAISALVDGEFRADYAPGVSASIAPVRLSTGVPFIPMMSMVNSESTGELTSNALKFTPAGSSSFARILSTPSGLDIRANRILLDSSDIRYASDTDWMTFSVSGWTVQDGQSAQVRVRNGMVQFRGVLSNSTFSGGFTTVGSLPAGIPVPPGSYAVGDIGMNSPAIARMRITVGGAVQFYRAEASGAWVNLKATWYALD